MIVEQREVFSIFDVKHFDSMKTTNILAKCSAKQSEYVYE